jgi:hypothetical protein
LVFSLLLDGNAKQLIDEFDLPDSIAFR